MSPLRLEGKVNIITRLVLLTENSFESSPKKSTHYDSNLLRGLYGLYKTSDGSRSEHLDFLKPGRYWKFINFDKLQSK